MLNKWINFWQTFGFLSKREKKVFAFIFYWLYASENAFKDCFSIVGSQLPNPRTGLTQVVIYLFFEFDIHCIFESNFSYLLKTCMHWIHKWYTLVLCLIHKFVLFSNLSNRGETVIYINSHKWAQRNRNNLGYNFYSWLHKEIKSDLKQY